MEPSFQLAALLLICGLFILLLELFIPSAGILFVLSTLCVLGSIVVAFMTSFKLGVLFLSGELLLTPIVAWGAFQIWKRSPIGRRMFLQVDQVEDESSPEERSSAHDPANFQSLLGEVGKTITPLRPVGTTEFSGRRVDTVAEGIMIDRGQWVRVVDVQGNRVVVRQCDAEENEQVASLEPFEI